jgi:hypothetical protein
MGVRSREAQDRDHRQSQEDLLRAHRNRSFSGPVEKKVNARLPPSMDQEFRSADHSYVPPGCSVQNLEPKHPGILDVLSAELRFEPIRRCTEDKATW